MASYHLRMFSQNVKRSIVLAFFITISLLSFSFSFSSSSSAAAETGQGKDVFRVILSVFGLTQGQDIITLVSVNDGENSKVKFIDSGKVGNERNASFIEYVATFPNVTVDVDGEYQACVIPMNELEMTCTTGHNSPASRPEVVDFTLNNTSSSTETDSGSDNGSGSNEESDEEEEE